MTISACVVNKQFELPEFVFDSVYVDLQYDEISFIFTAGSVCLIIIIIYRVDTPRIWDCKSQSRVCKL